jgi:hypothetical protein
MTSNQKNDSTTPPSAEVRPSSEEIIRQLEEFPVEVLEAALLVLQMRQTKPRQ